MNGYTRAFLQTMVTSWYRPSLKDDNERGAHWYMTALRLSKMMNSVLVPDDVERDVVEKFIKDGHSVMMNDGMTALGEWIESESINLGIFPDVDTMKELCRQAYIYSGAIMAQIDPLIIEE